MQAKEGRKVRLEGKAGRCKRTQMRRVRIRVDGGQGVCCRRKGAKADDSWSCLKNNELRKKRSEMAFF